VVVADSQRRQVKVSYDRGQAEQKRGNRTVVGLLDRATIASFHPVRARDLSTQQTSARLPAWVGWIHPYSVRRPRPGLLVGATLGVLYQPRSCDQVVEIMHIAARHRITVGPRGAASNCSTG